MTTDPWADYEAPRTGDFPEPFKWEPLGAAIVGTVTNIRKANFGDRDVPELYIMTDEGTERSVLCGQQDLFAKLYAEKPKVGDRIAIKYASLKPLGGGKTAKIFDVAVGAAGETVETEPVKSASAADLL